MLIQNWGDTEGYRSLRKGVPQGAAPGSEFQASIGSADPLMIRRALRLV